LGLNCNHSEVQEKFIELVLERTPFELEESKVSFAWKSPKTDPQKSSKVAVVAVPAFYGRGGIETGTEEKSVSEDFQHRVREALLTETDHNGMVLDLRGNPGGYLEEAVSLGAFFVGNKPIVGVLEEGKTRVLKNPSSNQTVYHRPLVVLVDESSASAAEVLTGALKDYQRAIVVGSSRTYGKGTVQRLFQLEDPFLFASEEGVLGTGVIKLTTSVFYSPLGHTPANGGVSTDIVLNDKVPQVNQKSLAHEILPIVDVELKSELQLSELKHQDQIEFLRGKSKERMETPTGLVEDKDLEEAIAIVSDLAHLDSF
jgi:carboxyl-terminal processing protease